ncbi:MAG: hypothetical protein E7310_07305 [Clostridiales bacterium]|nr:hypothetical protein [Clostridiales bacterium]
MSFSDIEKYLYPVQTYNTEKKENDMYDDWDEYEHTKNWINNIINEMQNGEDDILDIYYLEENNIVIGVICSLYGSNLINKFLIKNNINTEKKSAQLSCFHILKKYRGIGNKWLNDEVFKDLKSQGIQEIYIKSSHNKALSLYNRLGEVVGNYIGISDNNLYQRYGYVYKITL